MDRFGISLLCFLILVADSSSALDHSLISVSDLPLVFRVLFLTGPAGEYQFNFTEAREACLFKNLSLASRDHIQLDLDNGLETCRFGWVSEQVAVVPRRSSLMKCGSGKTGVVTWNADLHKKFGAWCLRDTKDSHKAVKTTNMAPHISTSYKTTLLPQITTTFTTTAAATTTTAITAITITTTTATTSTATTTTAAATIATTSRSTPEMTPSTIPTPPQTEPPHFYTSKSKSLLAFGSTSTQDLSEPMKTNSRPLRQRVLSTALSVFCVIVVVLSAGGAVFYYRISERSAWSCSPQTDEVETEMCKQTGSELEQDCQEDEEEEEEADRKYNSEVLLYVNPDALQD